MAWSFGDGFDLYATTADAVAGYWDSGTTANFTLVAGRFAGSQAAHCNALTVVILAKSSGVNDAVHHLVVAFRQTAVLSGSTLGLYFQLQDGATNQCCIVFRSDGAILLTSATPAGTVLATYTGAVTAANTWFAFEFEVVINNTTGRFRARKNGNTVDDFDSGATLNTRPGANSYANKLQVGGNTGVSAQDFDDLFWRSDASSVAWLGDIRCYTRMPSSDSGTPQFSRSPGAATQVPVTASTFGVMSAGVGRYTAFTAAYDGTIGTATVNFNTGYAGNLKCSIFASTGTAPTTVLGSANVLINPAGGPNTLTFATPVAVTKGTPYWIGFDSDAATGQWTVAAGTTGLQSTTAYASFPVASPATSGIAAIYCSLTIAPTANYQMVSEAQQDGTTTYVYDSTVNDADFYTIASIASTPVATIAVTTRGFMEKSDAGSRFAAVQLKSGGSTVASTAANLSSSWGWVWRTDVTDPATTAPWTAVGVNAVTIGPIVIS